MVFGHELTMWHFDLIKSANHQSDNKSYLMPDQTANSKPSLKTSWWRINLPPGTISQQFVRCFVEQLPQAWKSWKVAQWYFGRLPCTLPQFLFITFCVHGPCTKTINLAGEEEMHCNNLSRLFPSALPGKTLIWSTERNRPEPTSELSSGLFLT